MRDLEVIFYEDDTVLVNGILSHAKEFAYEGCHKIYLIENKEEQQEATELGYSIHPIKTLKECFNNSCPLKFILDWKLKVSYVDQFELEEEEEEDAED